MSPEFREQLSMVFPLADALQMRIKAVGKPKQPVLSGEEEFWMDCGAAKILLRPRIMGSYVDGEKSAVLVKVQKRLWLYVAYFKVNDALYLSIVDANPLGLKESTCHHYDGVDPHTVFEDFKAGTVGYYMRERNGSWIPAVNENNPVDEGRGELPQEESRPTGTPV